MIRLNILVEGQTELRFVKDVLAPHLADPFRVIVSPCLIETSRDEKIGRPYKGGVPRNYEKLRTELTKWIKNDKDENCRFTSLFDLYALPADFPGLDDSKHYSDPYERIHFVEQQFQEDINKDFARCRFLPYVQLHEFEALILADPQKLEIEYLDFPNGIRQLVEMVEGKNPELVNDKPHTAPSKRITDAIPLFAKNKPSGAAIVKEIGLPLLRKRCKHFGEWLQQLENLGAMS